MNRLVIIFIVFFLCGCFKQSKKDKLVSEMRAFYGREISFTDNLFLSKGNDSILTECLTAPYKIIAYVDSVRCTPCALEKMTLWEKYTPKLEAWNISLLFIVRNSNIDEVEETVKELQIPFPILFDVNGEFEYKNQLPADPLLRIFLLNQDNQVIFIGAPIQNEKSWTLFEKTMHN